MSVTYTAVLPVSDHTALFVAGLLHAERRRLGTRAGTRSSGCYRQAILVLCWLLDGTRIAQLATDNTLSRSTGYAYLHEGLTVIAAHAPSLSSTLLAAKVAGYAHVTIDGTLIETDAARQTRRPGRPVVVGKARQSWRERAGHHRPGRVAALDVTGASRS
jgi:hypothetical protein